MSKHKTAELDGYLLDAAVAKAEGATVLPGRIVWPDDNELLLPRMFNPSSDWRDAGPIIEREQIELTPPWDASVRHWARDWEAWTEVDCTGAHGPTALIAAMRAYVQAELGPEVELP